MAINLEWLKALHVGDRVRVVSPMGNRGMSAIIRIEEACKEYVAFKTSCGKLRRFSRNDGVEIGKTTGRWTIEEP